MFDLPVPEVEQEHHQRPEERRQASDCPDQQRQPDEELTPRNRDVDDLDEPDGLPHPCEYTREWVAVGCCDAEQVALRVERFPATNGSFVQPE